jgi:hypothetical protein
MRAAFAALICVIAIGAFAADLWFLDFFGPLIVVVPLPLLPLAIVGAFLVVRRAGDPIGWLLGAAGVLLQLVLLSNAYGYTSRAAGAALPGGEVAMWLGSFIWIAALGLVVSAMVRFPDGRPSGRTFAILLWAFVAFVVIGVVGVALAAQPIIVPPPFVGPHAGDPSRSIPNPFALHGPLGDLMLLVASAIDTFLALVLIAPVALVVRFRRSRGVEREQLKWLTYTAAIAFGLWLLAFVSPRGTIANLAQAASVVGIGLLPVAIGIAVTRYRLYDIDVLIRRTLIYAGVTALLAAAYIGGVALFQFVLAPFTAGSGVAVATSTLAVVALFQPVRRRIQSAVDHRFYRERYDAERTLDTFTARLREQIDLASLERELVGVVNDTMRPAHASVWLRKVAP